MREYYINYGYWKGWYPLYDGEEDFLKHNPNKTYKIWGDTYDILAYDWVMAWDGIIVQCLSKGKMIKQPNGNYVIPFRFPMCTAAIYYSAKKTKAYAFYALFTPPHKNAMSGSMKDPRKDQPKRLFGFLVSQGVDIYRAYKHIFKELNNQNRFTNNYHDRIAINQLLIDPVVREEFMAGSTPFMDKLKNEITEELLISEIKRGLTEAKPGTSGHKAMIEYCAQLLGFDGYQNVGDPSNGLPEKSPAKKLNKAQETPYEEIDNIPPPNITNDD